jgi:hypothetical protein
MKTRKAAGKDGFTVEALKHGGQALRSKVCEVVRTMWDRAASADGHEEGDDWPAEWRIGLVVPLWKRKGSKRDKNTYRGICLLSVGSKLLARVVASRLQRWTEGFVHESQCGNRRGRGVDDVLQVSRRVVEEVCRLDEDKWFTMSFFDLEKAFPKVCRSALWRLLDREGCDPRMLKVCKGLHENTRYAVRVQGGLSRTWLPDRGLREGCPSSPPLFKVYHNGVMQDFRARREEAAATAGRRPGIRWQYKVDGRMVKKATLRQEKEEGSRRDTEETVLGDFGFADDTGIVGEDEENRVAEGLMEETVGDWAGIVNAGKTERLWISGVPRQEMAPRREGERAVVRQLGGWLAEDGRQDADTAVRVTAGKAKIKAVAQAWGREGRFGRGDRSRVSRHVRLTIMKAAVLPTVLTFCKTRAWTRRQFDSVQRVAHYAVRRVLGLDSYNMQEHHLRDEALYRAVGWDTVTDMVMKHTLVWVGHVARMPITRAPKVALFGWVAGYRPRQHGVGMLQPRWMSDILERVGISDMDWFRLAQNRRAWKRRVNSLFERAPAEAEDIRKLNAWCPGDPLPALTPVADTHYTQRPRPPPAGHGFRCPVCDHGTATANSMTYHYYRVHAVRSAHVTTLSSVRCKDCFGFMSRDHYREHVCPARVAAQDRRTHERDGWLPIVHGPQRPPPEVGG